MAWNRMSYKKRGTIYASLKECEKCGANVLKLVSCEKILCDSCVEEQGEQVEKEESQSATGEES